MEITKLMRLIALSLEFVFVGARGEQSPLHSQANPPAVVSAVAPIFIPWVFGEPGVGQSVVEVRINPAGEVTSAKCVGGSSDFPWGDHSFEVAATRWRFSPTTAGARERSLRVTFVLRIMPKGTSNAELTPIYTAPYQMEVRHLVFEPLTIQDPNFTEGEPPTRKRSGNLQ